MLNDRVQQLLNMLIRCRLMSSEYSVNLTSCSNCGAAPFLGFRYEQSVCNYVISVSLVLKYFHHLTLRFTSYDQSNNKLRQSENLSIIRHLTVLNFSTFISPNISQVLTSSSHNLCMVRSSHFAIYDVPCNISCALQRYYMIRAPIRRYIVSLLDV